MNLSKMLKWGDIPVINVESCIELIPSRASILSIKTIYLEDLHVPITAIWPFSQVNNILRSYKEGCNKCSG